MPKIDPLWKLIEILDEIIDNWFFNHQLEPTYNQAVLNIAEVDAEDDL